MAEIADTPEEMLDGHWLQVWRNYVEFYWDFLRRPDEENDIYYKQGRCSKPCYTFESARYHKYRSEETIDEEVADLAVNFWKRNRSDLKEHFSNKQIHKKNSDEKINMLKGIGVDFNQDIDEDFRYGAWFKRVTFQKELDAETLPKVPESQRVLDENGKMLVTRSEVRQLKLGMPLSKIENRLAVVLGDEQPVEKEQQNETI